MGKMEISFQLCFICLFVAVGGQLNVIYKGFPPEAIMRAWFEKYIDRNGDGQTTKEEMFTKIVNKECFPGNMNHGGQTCNYDFISQYKVNATAEWAKIDKDGDGKASKTDYLNYARANWPNLWP